MDLSFNSTRNFPLFHQKPNKQNTKVWLFPGASASRLLASALVSGGKIPKVGFNLPRLSHHFSLEKRGKFVHPLRARPLRALFVTPPPPLPRNARRPGRPRKFDVWGKVGKFWGKNRWNKTSKMKINPMGFLLEVICRVNEVEWNPLWYLSCWLLLKPHLPGRNWRQVAGLPSSAADVWGTPAWANGLLGMGALERVPGVDELTCSKTEGKNWEQEHLHYGSRDTLTKRMLCKHFWWESSEKILYSCKLQLHLIHHRCSSFT